MNAQTFRDEIDRMLHGGLKIAWAVALEPMLRSLTSRERDAVLTTLENLMRERANNIAQVYGDRVAEEPDDTLHGPLDDDDGGSHARA